MSSYKKLVRDAIPDLIATQGEKPIMRTLDHDEYLHELVFKLLEEARECVAEKDSPHALLSELADLQEVIDALALLLEKKPGELRALQEKKRAERGGFSKRIFLIGVTE
jgi:predicted house-cleaning noncanonical NTP pyrophosphatase (MazG superfamily)